METSEAPHPAYRSKRGRISRACDRCRARKVRCDDLQPTCSNCLRSNVACITTNNDGVSSAPVVRRKTGSGQLLPTSSIEGRSAVIHGSNQALAQPNGSRHRQNTVVTVINLSPEALYTEDTQNFARDASSAEQPTPASRVSDFHTFTADIGTAVNADDSSIRRQHMGSSSLQVMTQWLSITFAAYGLPQSFSSQFQHGMRPAVEMQLSMTTQIPSLPTPHEIEAIATIYHRKSGSIFPVLLREEVSTLISLLTTFHDFLNLEAIHRPTLACLYALLSIGYDEQAGVPSDQGTIYLQAAYSMMSHILAMPYLSSVQALLLITIALMGRNKEGAGWYTLGQAVRMSYSIGIQRRPALQDKATDFQQRQTRRVWWIAYCLERIMVFETGRPTMIVDDQIDQDPPCETENEVTTLSSLVGLARIQGDISNQLYGVPNAAHNPSSYFQTMAEIVTKLTSWLRSQPDLIRPDQEPLCCGPGLILFATYLGFQYHQVLITLHRLALLFDNKIYEQQLSSVDLEDSTYHRLRAGESICVSSARAIVTLLSNALQQKYTTRLFTLTPPLLATYVLAIQLIKHPLAWSSTSDLKLMVSSSKRITNLYIASGQTPGFYAMLQDLQRLSEQSVRYATSSHAATPTRAHSPNGLISESVPGNIQPELTADFHEAEHRQNTDMSMSMANFELYQSLPFFFDHDLENDDLRAEDACHLFGLPIVGDDFGVSDELT